MCPIKVCCVLQRILLNKLRLQRYQFFPGHSLGRALASLPSYDANKNTSLPNPNLFCDHVPCLASMAESRKMPTKQYKNVSFIFRVRTGRSITPASSSTNPCLPPPPFSPSPSSLRAGATLRRGLHLPRLPHPSLLYLLHLLRHGRRLLSCAYPTHVTARHPHETNTNLLSGYAHPPHPEANLSLPKPSISTPNLLLLYACSTSYPPSATDFISPPNPFHVRDQIFCCIPGT